MGNFKHHSLRNSDRDRDKDGEKDREREIRDKEGQDRLRHVSIWSIHASFTDFSSSWPTNMTETGLRNHSQDRETKKGTWLPIWPRAPPLEEPPKDKSLRLVPVE